MAKIIINGTELTGEVYGTKQHYQNAYRDILTFKIDAEGRSFDATVALFTGADEIVIEDTRVETEYDGDGNPALDEDGNPVTREITESFTYADYTIPVKRAIEREEVTPETPSSPAVYRDVFVISLAQKTYMEKQLEQVLRLLQG